MKTKLFVSFVFFLTLFFARTVAHPESYTSERFISEVAKTSQRVAEVERRGNTVTHGPEGSNFISPEEIHEGMVGYGKTVFHGTQVETFKVVVLGVLHKALANNDIILVRVYAPQLDEKHLGLVAGMSGSPVYFNGRLAGAIAYGWPFTPEAVAGITPIRAMLSSGQGSHQESSADFGAPSSLNLPNIPIKAQAGLPSFLSSTTLEPLGIPMAASGFDASGMSTIKSLFPTASIIPAGTRMSVSDPPAIEPGQAVGAALMEGDLNLVATGTVTYRSGANILAFGHPFLFLGHVELPMVQSYVHYVLPSSQQPFKFSSPVRDIGSVTQDRLYAIGGNLNRHARMVPMDMVVTDEERHASHHFHVSIIRHPDLTPRLAALAIEQAIPATAKLMGGATARIDYRLVFEDHPPIRVRNVVFSEQSIASAVSSEVLRPVLQVLGNDFEKVNLQKIFVDVSVQPRLAVSTIQKVTLNKHHLLPGEPLSVTVFLKPYNEKPVEKTFMVNIPTDVQGTVQVGVAGGAFDDQLRKTMQQPLPQPLNVSQIVKQIQDASSYNSLVIRLTYPRKSISWAGEDFSNMPQPYADLLKAAGSNPVVLHSDGAEYRHDMPWVVVGSDLQEIVIQGKESASSSLKSSPNQLPGFPSQPLPVPPSDSPGEPTVKKYDTTSSMPSSLSAVPSSSSSSSSSGPSLETQRTNIETYGNLSDWQEGVLHGLAISPQGDLFLGPQINVTPGFQENVLWTQASFGNNLYVGTANPGKIYKIQAGEKELFSDPNAVAITSLATLPKGDLLAAATGGKLYRFSSDGKVISRWKLPENYLWQILPSGNTVYIAAGGPRGRIYKMNLEEANPEPTSYYTSSDSHITSLYMTNDNHLFAGTANHALLLEISPDGTSKTLYDLDEQAILSLTGDNQGNLYIGTSGKGKVYCLNTSKKLNELANFNEDHITWLGRQGDSLLVATGIPARLYAVKPNGSYSLLWDGKPNEQVALKGTFGDDSNGRKWFSVSGNNADLLEIQPTPSSHGEFLSKVVDTGTKATWGRLLWYGQIPMSTDISLETRSGNSAIPDPSWSAWSKPYPAGGAPIISPSSRYLQFRILLNRNQSKESPHLEAVKFFWKAETHPPSLTITTPQAGDVIGPKSTLRGKIQNKDGDIVRLNLWIESAQNKSEHLYSNSYTVLKSKGEEDFSIPLNIIHEDGAFSLKVMIAGQASDETQPPSNPEVVIKDLTYDAATPGLTITRSIPSQGSLRVEGMAEDKASYIKSVEFRVDGGSWLPAIAENGLFDSPEEYFHFVLDNTSEIKEVDIRALDAADNEKLIHKTIKELFP